MVRSHPGQGAAVLTTDSDGKDISPECGVCGDTFKNEYYLKKHYRNNDSDCFVQQCEHCGRTDFVSSKGRKQHESKAHDHPYKHEDTLRKLYVEQGMGMQKIADKFGVADKTIHDWLKKHDIEARDRLEKLRKNKANYNTNYHGYEMWRAYDDGKYRAVAVHRLLAVAIYGFDEFSGQVVHHKNEIKWDNRPENIEIMGDSEHKRMHAYDTIA